MDFQNRPIYRKINALVFVENEALSKRASFERKVRLGALFQAISRKSKAKIGQWDIDVNKIEHMFKVFTIDPDITIKELQKYFYNWRYQPLNVYLSVYLIKPH